MISHWISGAPYRGANEGSAPVYDPGTGEAYTEVTLGDAETVNRAVSAAQAAFPAWAATPPLKRARVLFRFNALLQQHKDELAELLSKEHGKTLPDAGGEMIRAIEVVEFACGIPHLLKGSFSAEVSSAIDAYSFRQPLGVVAGITPFNFPGMVPMWMFPIALACGNTFILKPSERNPTVNQRVAELLKEAGLPDGVFNIVQGGKPVVDAILAHPAVEAISFVGSTPVAEYIYKTGCAHNKRVQALGGAKNHMLILPDADMDQAAEALLGAGFGSAGERCMAISVAVPVGEGTAEALLERLKPMVEGLKIGHYSDPESEMGPLITGAHRDRVKGLIDEGVAAGATLVVDGRDFKSAANPEGFYLGGTLFDHVTPEMSIYTEEIFGPVLSMVRVPDYEAGVSLIHDNPYGNGVAIFTRDGDAARDFVDRIQVGMVGVNVPIPVPVAYHSFGGWKRSLFGSHHIYGPESVHFYTKLKAVTSRWPAGIKAGASLVFPTME
ncbi:MAG: CoA-acylating methylmalonate-semialdehyde dehydrogenase [Myxococcota bacterium]|nr:CoA-acylating methylmalonate-semialdehyde dehydrogenase [Myxococcota bacterium]